VELFRLRRAKSAWEIELLAGFAALCMLVSGGFYVASHERLSYADLSTCELVRSKLPALAASPHAGAGFRNSRNSFASRTVKFRKIRESS